MSEVQRSGEMAASDELKRGGLSDLTRFNFPSCQQSPSELPH